MAVSLRKRSAEEAGFSQLTRSKRCAAIVSDEVSQSLRPKPRHARQHDPTEELDLDILSDITPIKTRGRPSRVAPLSAKTQPQRVLANRPVDEDVENEENRLPTPVFTPQTPRHRDALSKQAPYTPRHRVLVGGKSFTPQTARTPSSQNSFSTIYNEARLLFARSSNPGKLVGREAERTELSSFIDRCLSTRTSNCIYISGPPGTGKSALCHEVVSQYDKERTVKKAYINCMSIKSSKDLVCNLAEALQDGEIVIEDDQSRTLHKLFNPTHDAESMYVVVLDEMDHILSLDLDLLYKLFEWSLQKASRLVLIGIANALDLTDRLLPRLKARNLKPRLLPFMPYTAPQIKSIVISRLKSLVPINSTTPDYVPFIHPAAIDLCSRKVAGQGDLRKVLDVCRRAIDIIESQTRSKHQQELDEHIVSSPSRTVLGELSNLSSPSTQATHRKTLAESMATLTVETAPRATIAHINKITAAVFSNGNNQRLKTLNLQQKAVLCALIALEKHKRTALTKLTTPSKLLHGAPTVKALYNIYCLLCRRDAVLQPLTSTEFRDVIGSLETLSLISALDGKNGSFLGLSTPSKRKAKMTFGGGAGSGDEKRVGSCVGEKELESAVEGLGAGILRSILSGEGLE